MCNYRSASVGKKAFRKMLEWTAQIGGLFEIGTDYSQIAIVQFGDVIKTEYDFTDHQVPAIYICFYISHFTIYIREV